MQLASEMKTLSNLFTHVVCVLMSSGPLGLKGLAHKYLHVRAFGPVQAQVLARCVCACKCDMYMCALGPWAYVGTSTCTLGPCAQVLAL